MKKIILIALMLLVFNIVIIADNGIKSLLNQEVWLDMDIKTLESILADKSNINFVDDEGYSALYYAISGNCGTDIINYLLEYGADVTNKTIYGETILLFSLSYNTHSNILEALISAGADINAGDDYGIVPIMRAKNKDELTFLIENGAEINFKTPNDGITPLMQYASYSTSEMVKLLLDLGAEVNAKSSNGSTALMGAAANNIDLDVIKLLIEAGADVNVKNNDGETAITLADAMDNNIVKMFLLDSLKENR